MSINRRECIQLLSSAALLPFLPKLAWATIAGTLLWKRPSLVNPTIIDVTSDSPNSQTQRLDSNTDYIIRIGKDTRGVVTREAVTIIGGRNVQIIGGHIIRPENTPTSDANTGAKLAGAGVMLGISSQTGGIYIEGLLIDVKKQYGVDAIEVGAQPGKPGSDYIFQNIHIRGVHGTSKGNHADGLQAVGPIKKLYMHRATLYSSCQALELAPLTPIEDAQLDSCNTRYPNPDFNSGGANGFAFWLGNGSDSQQRIDSSRYRFKDVYVQERINYGTFPWADGSIAPGRHMPRANQMYDNDPNKAFFPGYHAEGYVNKGVPPGGDFTPPEVIIDSSGAVIYDAANWS